MQTSKHNWSNDSRKQRFVFFQIGLIIAILLVIMAFEWTVPKKTVIDIPPIGCFDSMIIYNPPPLPTSTREIPPVIKKNPIVIKPVPSPLPEPPPIEPTKSNDESKNPNTTLPIVQPMPDENGTDEPPLQFAQIMPEFPGGEKALMKFVYERFIHHSKSCGSDEKISGKIFVFFVVDKKGMVSNIEVKRGLTDCLNEATIATVKDMPKWTPGIVGGKFVSVWYNLPIVYRSL